MLLLNIALGTLVTTVGFWLLWGATVPVILVVWTLTVSAFLWWKAGTIAEVWAWSTLLLGLESIAWPIILMTQLPPASAIPSDEEMGAMLSAIVLALFSSVFWIAFSYGLFKRGWTAPQSQVLDASRTPDDARQAKPKKKAR
jgi:hypothetical protein